MNRSNDPIQGFHSNCCTLINDGSYLEGIDANHNNGCNDPIQRSSSIVMMNV